MKRFKILLGIFAACVALFVGWERFQLYQIGRNDLPIDVDAALHTPKKVTLYSLEPLAAMESGSGTFYGFKILGRLDLNPNQSGTTVQAFRDAIPKRRAPADLCFRPRHALRMLSSNHTYDLLLCYKCKRLEIYRDGTDIANLSAVGSPVVLNGLLTAAGIPLAKSAQ